MLKPYISLLLKVNPLNTLCPCVGRALIMQSFCLRSPFVFMSDQKGLVMKMSWGYEVGLLGSHKNLAVGLALALAPPNWGLSVFQLNTKAFPVADHHLHIFTSPHLRAAHFECPFRRAQCCGCSVGPPAFLCTPPRNKCMVRGDFLQYI